MKAQETTPQLYKTGNTHTELVIAACAQNKIGECTRDDIGKAIKYCFVVIGLPIKQFPEGIEKDVLIDFLISEYGNKYTCEEIKLAFKWAVSNHIDVDRETWGMRFSPSYIAKFMDAYQAHKVELRNKLREHNKHQKQLAAQNEKPLVSPEKLEEYSKQFENELSKFVAKKKPVSAISITDVVYISGFKEKIDKVDSVQELKSIRKDITDQILTCKESEVAERRKQLRIVDERINYLMDHE